MKVVELLAGCGAEQISGGRAAIDVLGVSSDSRKVERGHLFVALPGTKVDGLQFVDEAKAKGAVAVLTEQREATSLPTFVVSNARQALATLASNFYKRPSDVLVLLGVTGTNGKTTTACLLESICAASGANTGLIGTVQVKFDGKSREPTHTTPDAIELHRTMREMVDSGVDTVVMEVSSHALAQERVHGLVFKAAAFTNLSRDHLDYHADMEAYFQAKRTLFTGLLSPGGMAVVSGEDTYGARIYSELRQGRRMAWKFSREGNGELSATHVEFSMQGIRATLKTPAGDIPIRSSLIGPHNLDNILAAAGMALGAGFARRDVQEGVERLVNVPGRMERIEYEGRTVLVDYAHSDDALRRVLEAARGLAKGKLIAVFGCGGDRDRGKRPLMGQAAAEVADWVVVTSDNPRKEDPDEIVGEITPGVEKAGLRRISAGKARSGERGYFVEVDRRAAIEMAVSLAKPGDLIVLAGKGHETTQIVGAERKRFDDREEAQRALANAGKA
ncbi:MAG: UDP-N-acetylmuramoyl-L-alanyl-D-glutamate--2,6-diaminopimelate ligase [Myxococcaceae bacterium]